MKKWISLLLAGILVSAVMVGCKKEEEGATTPSETTGGKMEEKSTEPSKTESGAGENKMEGGTKAPEGETK